MTADAAVVPVHQWTHGGKKVLVVRMVGKDFSTGGHALDSVALGLSDGAVVSVVKGVVKA